MKEIFKDIEGYFGLYQVSNLGIVKALGNGNSNNSKERILKPTKRSDEYLMVSLCKQGKRKQHYIHRLVAQAFIDNPNNFREINHKDEDKTNNCVSNLEWCDAKYNHNYGTRNIRAASSNTNHPNKSKQVLCVETNIIYPSTKEVERQLVFKQQSISSACRGKLKTCGGFHWKYVN